MLFVFCFFFSCWFGFWFWKSIWSMPGDDIFVTHQINPIHQSLSPSVSSLFLLSPSVPSHFLITGELVSLFLLALPRVSSLTRLYSVIMFRLWSNSHHEENDVTKRELKINELKAAIGPLSGRNSQYCSDACFKRYLEARNWNIDKSKKMLDETLKWRSTFKPEEIRWNQVAVEGETGKIYRANFHDRFGRTVLILRPGMQNTTSLDNQMRHLVYLIENAILNLAEGQEQMSWLIDFTGWTLSTNVPIKSARDTINILQNHYPERLAVAFLYNPPRIFEAFWKIVKYFLDAKTFAKVKFVYPKNKESVELMRTYFDEENLPTEFGGKATLNYNHEEFSALMTRDDAKTVALWGLDGKSQHLGGSNGHCGAEVAPEPLAPPARLA